MMYFGHVTFNKEQSGVRSTPPTPRHSLLGLYDLKSVSVKLKAEVWRLYLYLSGLISLEAMLPPMTPVLVPSMT